MRHLFRVLAIVVVPGVLMCAVSGQGLPAKTPAIQVQRPANMTVFGFENPHRTGKRYYASALVDALRYFREFGRPSDRVYRCVVRDQDFGSLTVRVLNMALQENLEKTAAESAKVSAAFGVFRGIRVNCGEAASVSFAEFPIGKKINLSYSSFSGASLPNQGGYVEGVFDSWLHIRKYGLPSEKFVGCIENLEHSPAILILDLVRRAAKKLPMDTRRKLSVMEAAMPELENRCGPYSS